MAIFPSQVQDHTTITLWGGGGQGATSAADTEFVLKFPHESQRLSGSATSEKMQNPVESEPNKGGAPSEPRFVKHLIFCFLRFGVGDFFHEHLFFWLQSTPQW
jgi:hypothetical protein